MSDSSERFLRYLPNRDVVFVLGAGASHPDGVPLQREMLPMIISGGIEEIESSEIGKIVSEFIKDKAYIATMKGGDLVDELKATEIKYKAFIKKSTLFELAYKPSNSRNEKDKKLVLLEINK